MLLKKKLATLVLQALPMSRDMEDQGAGEWEEAGTKGNGRKTKTQRESQANHLSWISPTAVIKRMTPTAVPPFALLNAPQLGRMSTT